MPLIQAMVNEEVFTSAQKTKITICPADAISNEKENMDTVKWDDIEEILSEEWEIGGSAITTDAICTLIAG